MRVCLLFCLLVLAAWPLLGGVVAGEQQDSAPAIEGTVEDPEGYAVEGAAVIATSAAARFRDPPITTSVDLQGRFRLLLNDAGPHDVVVQAPGFVPWRARRAEPGSRLRVVLLKGEHVIEGIVRDGATLEPVAGARVQTQPGTRSARLPPSEPTSGAIETVTDEEGLFRLEGLGPARANVSARARGYARATRRQVLPGETVELFLFPGSSIFGSVLGLEEEPLENALVQVMPETGRRRRFARGSVERTAEDGFFELLGLEPGTYRLVVRHRDLAPKIVSGISLREGEETELNVYLTPGVRVSGRLVDEEDEPVSGEIVVENIDGNELVATLRGQLTASSAEDGEFLLPSLPSGSHEIGVRAAGFAPQRVEVAISERDETVDLGDILLETGLAIRGYVVDGNEVGIPGAQLTGFALGRGRGGRARAGRAQLEARTESDGSFVLAGLEPGSYRLFARAPGYGSANQRAVRAGTEDLKVILEPAGTIQGKGSGSRRSAGALGYGVGASARARSGRCRRLLAVRRARRVVCHRRRAQRHVRAGSECSGG